MTNNDLPELTDADFDSVVKGSPTPVVVDFWAPWCDPCKILGTMLSRLAVKYEGSVKIVKMNVDEEKSAPAEYAVRSLPTILMFKKGKIANQIIGSPSEDEIDKAISRLL